MASHSCSLERNSLSVPSLRKSAAADTAALSLGSLYRHLMLLLVISDGAHPFRVAARGAVDGLYSWRDGHISDNQWR